MRNERRLYGEARSRLDFSARPASLRSRFRPVSGMLLLALAACIGGDERGAEVGDRAPDYSAPDLSGQEISLASQRGRVVLVNIWATWCGPCRVEMPPIQASYERYREHGFNVLAVSIDAGPGYRENVEEFVHEHGLEFPILLDPESRISGLLNTIGVPETFVLDKEGRIVKRLIGATDWDSPANQALIEELLGM
ncbi:MAG: TlpA family protein disulfide reductase [Gemmatimonadota bacterium]|nr:MAG: TlpA family protein disulfide reductase [Gemmatimonadota bacterium]